MPEPIFCWSHYVFQSMATQQRQILQYNEHIFSWNWSQGLTDPIQFFVVKKLIKGAQHLSSTTIFFQLVKALNVTVCGKCNKRLLAAMFTLRFFAFLRVGEITANSIRSRKNLIPFSSLKKYAKQEYMSLTLQHFRHNDTGRPVCLQISAQKCKTICPVKSMAKYLKEG